MSADSGDVWSQDFHANLKRLETESKFLEWPREPAKASFASRFSMFGWPIKIWDRLIDEISASAVATPTQDEWVMFGYDWRQDINEAAKLLATSLSDRVRTPVRQERSTEAPFLFVTHSMGGLLLRSAIGQKILHPTWISKVVHIGVPFRGAPLTYLAAFDPRFWPFDYGLFKSFAAIRYDTMAIKGNLQKAALSFPSYFQLLPCLDQVYVTDSRGKAFNPLSSPEAFSEAERVLASSLQENLVEANRLLPDRLAYLIHGADQSTPVHLTVAFNTLKFPSRAGVTALYKVENILEKPKCGDGVVPRASAVAAGGTIVPMLRQRHSWMCNDQDVARKTRECIQN